MTAIFWADEADYLYSQGEYDEAIGFYDRAIEAASKNG
jgi:tetratricopeptide (TPR) repeat protein